ncbi:hypothetical protein MAL02_19205 (plasmid) [Leptospira noguchii]|nr:hypothetical protein [Leptospira noguchii]UOG36285.1 hypothetical protein MAL02_19205 [Leptospira noguchii]
MGRSPLTETERKVYWKDVTSYPGLKKQQATLSASIESLEKILRIQRTKRREKNRIGSWKSNEKVWRRQKRKWKEYGNSGAIYGNRQIKTLQTTDTFRDLALFSPLFSQVEEYEDCFFKEEQCGLEELEQETERNSVEGVFYTSNANIPAKGMDWQTSFKPHKSVSKSRPKNMSQNEWAEETCGLNAYRVQDQREATRWCEGVPGTGIGRGCGWIDRY